MSGIVQNNILRSSGTIAVSAAGLNWNDTIITGSTATVEAGNGYWINTTSNTCTITLPSSAESGDQIVLIDYARTWGTNKIIIDSNGLNYQGNADTYTVEYTTDGQSLNIVYSDATKGWLPLEDDVVAEAPEAPNTQRAIFAYGDTGSVTNLSNLVNSSGVVAADVTGVGTARAGLAAATYGGDKAIFGYGGEGSLTNLVSNSGVVSTDTTGVGTVRNFLAATSYGGDKAIFGYGDIYSGGYIIYSLKNLVSNSGVVASDVTGVGTARRELSATTYGGDKGMFAYGNSGGATMVSLKNLISNTGVVAADVSGVGTARNLLAASYYGEDKAIFAYGQSSGGNTNVSNLVTNLGVIGADVSGVGTSRRGLAAASYGGDKGVFAFGYSGANVSLKNLVNNSGVISADVTGVGTGRSNLGAAGYSYSA
jgi:hypothetical protein